MERNPPRSEVELGVQGSLGWCVCVAPKAISCVHYILLEKHHQYSVDTGATRGQEDVERGEEKAVVRTGRLAT